MPAEIFFGYPSRPPMLRETLTNAAGLLNSLGDVHVTTWEDLAVDGRVLWDQVADAIDRSDLTAFEVTQLNPNVYFELGYALGKNKPIWPLRDTTDASARHAWDQLGTMLTIGFASYTNSEDIRARFLAERPDIQNARFFEESVQPRLEPRTAPSVLHLAGAVETEAARALTRTIRASTPSPLTIVTADPAEAAFQPLTWYAQHVYNAYAVVVHMVARRRTGAEVHNLRLATAAGMACGLGKPLLILAEEDIAQPLDYRDLVYVYDTAEACSTRAAYWLPRHIEHAREAIAEAAEQANALKLTTELRSVDIGEYVAENEERDLPRYWVETPVYREVLGGFTRIVVGRKGTGKSATLIRSAAELRKDRRNVVCVIKPEGYDLEGVVRLLAQYRERDAKGYLVESLWKYLLLTELALVLDRELQARPAGIEPGTPAWDLVEFFREQGRMFETDFAVRLERAVTNLLGPEVTLGSVEAERVHIAERLHAGPIRELRRLVAAALRGRERVCVLVDNLDKSWERTGPLPDLVQLILGLLTSIDGFAHDLESEQGRVGVARVTVAVFVRSDIYSAVAATAREPDKLPTTRLQWPDPDDLIGLVEQRYAAGRAGQVDPSRVWERYFVAQVRGTPTPDYLAQVTFPRPRDMLYITRAAIDTALTRRHGIVEEEDVLNAEHLYSQFAYEAMRVETDIPGVNIDDLLLEFAGSAPLLAEAEVHRYIGNAGGGGKEAEIIDRLRDVAFLGVKTGPDQFVFSDDPKVKRRTDVLSNRLQQQGQARAYRVNRALWAFLEIADQGSLL